MVSITLSVPEEIKEKMAQFDEVNWSGFIRKCIIEKAEDMEWKEKMLKRLKEEHDLDSWAVGLSRKSRKGRAEKLKRMGLIR